MPDPVTATVGGLLAGVQTLNSINQRKAASKAASAQIKASEKGIEEIQRQFDAMQEILKPYQESGEKSLRAQEAYAGLSSDPMAMAKEIEAAQASPEYKALTQSGEAGILSNASATGGLRGGNVQGALAQFRPEILSKLLNERYARLGGLTQIGQASAVEQASAGMQTGANVANLFGEIGSANAGRALGQGKALTDVLSNISGLGGLLAGKYL